jgi:hypothetical protein
MKRTKTKAKSLLLIFECVLFGEPTHAQKGHENEGLHGTPIVIVGLWELRCKKEAR